MGTFGHKAFENDSALDCIDELVASNKPSALIKSIARKVTSSSERDAVNCARAIAIAEAATILRGHPPRTYPDELKRGILQSGYLPRRP